MPDFWDPVYEHFRFSIVMVGVAVEPAKYSIRNTASNNRHLGYLMLTQDEASKMSEMFNQPTLSRSTTLTSFLKTYMRNPDSYGHNGRMLSTYTAEEQVGILSTMFERGTVPPPI